MDYFLSIVGWVLWCIVLYFAVSLAIGCRRYAASGQHFMWATAIQTFFAWALVIGFLSGQESKLHLIWMIPVLFFVAQWVALDQLPLISPVIKTMTRGFMAILLVGTKPPR